MGTISLLLADDSITIQKVVGIIFAGSDYSLTVVDNGKSAVQKAQELNPDVLLIDALMPGMNGYEVCEAIRAIPELSTKPLLLLTGSFEPFDEEKAVRCGADGHLAKPFESQQIIAKVHELYAMGQQRTTGAVPAAAVVESAPAPTQPEPAFNLADFEPAAPAAVAETVAAPVEPAVAKAAAPVSPDDPWGAFTLNETPAETTVVLPADTATVEPDVFALVTEEPPAAAPAADSTVGASWVPVEEQTFEFREEIAEAPADTFAVQPEDSSPFEQTAYDQSAFEQTAFDQSAFEQTTVLSDEGALAPETAAAVQPPVAEPVTAPVAEAAPAPLAAAAAGTVALSEEQLRQALAAASRETIERIVWEVVPDLAESLIKEAIRRITEGK